VSRKKRGHFCWCCRRLLPNERFSGGSHARHLCRECAHLPAEEREYRQCERDIERLLHDGLHIPRKRRTQSDRFPAHPNARVQELARRILDEQRREAEDLRRMRAAEEVRSEDLDATGPGSPGAGSMDDEGPTTGEPEPPDDDDLPF
jgi:hypothetical protein